MNTTCVIRNTKLQQWVFSLDDDTGQVINPGGASKAAKDLAAAFFEERAAKSD